MCEIADEKNNNAQNKVADVSTPIQEEEVI